MRRAKPKRELTPVEHSVLTALVMYLRLPEPQTISEMMVYAIQSNALVFKIDSELERHERETGDEILRLIVRREMLKLQLARQERRKEQANG